VAPEAPQRTDDSKGEARRGYRESLTLPTLSSCQMKPLVKPFLLAMAPEVGPLVGKTFNMRNILPVEKLRSEIDLLMYVPLNQRSSSPRMGMLRLVLDRSPGKLLPRRTEKLQELTPEKVKALMEEVCCCWFLWKRRPSFIRLP